MNGYDSSTVDERVSLPQRPAEFENNTAGQRYHRNVWCDPGLTRRERVDHSASLYWAGFVSGWFNGTGLPKCGLPNSSHVNRWMRGEREFLQPSPGAGFA